MPYTNIGDVKLYYEIYGSEYEVFEDHIRKKPTLVSVHGGPGSDHMFWDVYFLAELANFAQVILFDQRGNGRSIDPNPEHWNLAQWAEDLHSFCRVVGLEKPFVRGVSFGGYVVQKYASQYSAETSGIVLMDTEAYLDVERMLDAFEAKGGKEVREIARRSLYFLDEEAGADYFEKCLPLCSQNPIPSQWLKRTILTPEVNEHFGKNELLSFNLLDDVKNITAPVLYLTGTTNPYHFLPLAQETRDAMINTQVEFIEFPDCGLVAMDAKKEALVEIKRFLEKYFIG